MSRAVIGLMDMMRHQQGFDPQKEFLHSKTLPECHYVYVDDEYFGRMVSYAKTDARHSIDENQVGGTNFRPRFTRISVPRESSSSAGVDIPVVVLDSGTSAESSITPSIAKDVANGRPESKEEPSASNNNKETAVEAVKRTDQASKRKRLRTHGMQARLATKNGRKILKRGANKGRKFLTV